MDRFDLWTVFLAVADKGSFVGAARHLNRSPAAITRAVAALEDHLAVRLLTRTTRSVALTEAGERYLEMCRRLLADIRETEAELAGEGGELHGNLAITAPVVFGRLHLLPLVDDFMAAHPRLTVSLALLDRQVSLVEEGLDIALRIGHLRDASLRAVRVGGVRRVVCATPDYLARHGTPRTPHDLVGHRVIAFTGVQRQPERWPFVFPEGEASVAVMPRLLVNSVEAAWTPWCVAAASAGCCRTRSPPWNRPAGWCGCCSRGSRQPCRSIWSIPPGATCRARCAFSSTPWPPSCGPVSATTETKTPAGGPAGVKA